MSSRPSDALRTALELENFVPRWVCRLLAIGSSFVAYRVARGTSGWASPLSLSMFAAISAAALFAVAPATNGIKRRVLVLHDTVIMLGGYKLARRQAKALPDKAARADLFARRHAVLSIYLHRAIRRLGGFWVKAGQYLSARADVMPAAYIQELKELQDGVPPSSFADVSRIIREDLGGLRMWVGAAIGTGTQRGVLGLGLFSSVAEEPLASASIAQVHRARLLADGREIVLKVQHPGVGWMMKLDMAALLAICRFVAWSEPEYNFEPLMTEWTKAAVHELDFHKERTALTAVADGLEDAAHLRDRVLVPRAVGLVRTKKTAIVSVLLTAAHEQEQEQGGSGMVVEPLCSRRVLALDFSAGLKIGDAFTSSTATTSTATSMTTTTTTTTTEGAADPDAILQAITEATAHQIFHVGVFSGDPHPGNVLVDLACAPPGPRHRPVLLDFGLCKQLATPLRLALASMVVAAADVDAGALVESFEAMGFRFDDFNDPGESMDMMRFFFRATKPPGEAKAELRQFDRAVTEKVRARREAKIRQPVKAFPGDILFFIRALELLRGLCSTFRVRQAPLRILAASARAALVAEYESQVQVQEEEEEKKRSGRREAAQLPLSLLRKRRQNAAMRPLSSSSSSSSSSSLQARLEQMVRGMQQDGRVLGLQLAVIHRGRLVVDIASGPLSSLKGDPRRIRPDTVFSSFSTTKGIAATALLMLIADGKAAASDLVVAHWPEYASRCCDAVGRQRKATTTIAEVLSHRAGLAAALPPNMSMRGLCNWGNMVRAMEEAVPDPAVSPATAQYHFLTFGWLVGALVEKIAGNGVTFSAFVADRIAGKLGLSREFLIGVPPALLLAPWMLEKKDTRAGREGTATGEEHEGDEEEELLSVASLDNPLLEGRGADGAGLSNLQESSEEMNAIVQRTRQRTQRMQVSGGTGGQGTAAGTRGTEKEEKKTDLGANANDDDDDEAPSSSMLELMQSMRGKEFLLDSRLWNSRRVRAATIPAANGHFSARALALFYGALMQPLVDPNHFDADGDGDGDGDARATPQLLPRAVLAEATTACATEESLSPLAAGAPGDAPKWGLGYSLYPFKTKTGSGGETKYEYGFGHRGMGGSVGIAIPHGDVSIGLTVSRLHMGSTAMVPAAGDNGDGDGNGNSAAATTTGKQSPLKELLTVICEELGLGEGSF